MLKRKSVSLLAAACAIAVSAMVCAGQDPNVNRTYEVTVTNLTGGVVLNDGAPAGQIMSPPVVAAHNYGLTPLFQLGSAASTQLSSVAEDAVNDPLVTMWSADPNVIDVEQGSGPIMPGHSATIHISTKGGFGRISLVGMLVTTNDGFYALNGMALPLQGSVTYYSPGYDAGSEVDSESCEYIPGPPCGNAGMRDTSGAPGYVFIHSGIHGIGDLEPAQFDWQNPVAEITITAIQGNMVP